MKDVGPDEMRLVYSGAIALVTASFSEGFGYSGVEAMSCGTPIIASNIPCYREVYRDAAIYCDPYDTHSIADAFRSILQHKFGEIRHSQLERWQHRGKHRSVAYRMESLLPRWKDWIRF
jgi:glycosyltransferase involved in cell wall biosynthesis